MAQFDRESVQKLAELAHLSLSEQELDGFSSQLEQILEYAARIQALDTEGVAPTSQVLLRAGLDGGAGLRDDEPTESLDRDEILASAPDASDGLFKVPKVLP